MNTADRPVFATHSQQLLTFAAVLVGKNSIFTLPSLLYRYGGVPFFIAYATVTVSLVIPVMQLETTLSQFSGAGCIGIFDTVPGMRGLGYTMCFYFALGLVTFTTECAYSSVFLVNWLHSPVPWQHCGHSWSTDSCFAPQKNMVLCSSLHRRILEQYRDSRETQGVPVTDGTTTVFVPEADYNKFNVVNCVNGSTSAVQLFFDSKVLRLSTDGNDAVHPEMTITTAALWLIVFAVIRNGLHNAKYAMYTITAVSGIILTLMFTNSLALKHSDHGVGLLLQRPLWGLLNYELWRDALKLAISNIGFFSGGFLNVTRFNPFKSDISTLVVTVTIMQVLSSFLYGLLFFAHAGYLSFAMDTDIEDILQAVDVEHVLMPEALTFLDSTGFWSMLYFTWLLANALGYMMIGPEVFLEAVLFEFPGFTWLRNELCFLGCFFFYVCGLALTTTPGPFLIKLLLPNVEIIAALCLLLEVLVCIRLYGLHRVMVDYHTMMGRYPNLHIRMSWAIGVPIQLALLIVLELVQPSIEGYRSVTFSSLEKLFGVWTIAFAVSFIPSYLVALLTAYPWEKLMVPASTWLPEDKAVTHEYRVLLQDFGYASKGAPHGGAEQPSVVTSGQTSIGGAGSRGETVTVAETIDPREVAGGTERSVTFAPDVLTTPHYTENFNDLLDRQFGLHSSRTVSPDGTFGPGFLLDESSMCIPCKVPGITSNIEEIPAAVFSKEDVEEIRKAIGDDVAAVAGTAVVAAELKDESSSPVKVASPLAETKTEVEAEKKINELLSTVVPPPTQAPSETLHNDQPPEEHSAHYAIGTASINNKDASQSTSKVFSKDDVQEICKAVGDDAAGVAGTAAVAAEPKHESSYPVKVVARLVDTKMELREEKKTIELPSTVVSPPVQPGSEAPQHDQTPDEHS
ncbi:sodium-dependent proline transporter-like [Amblyomma americanum]